MSENSYKEIRNPEIWNDVFELPNPNLSAWFDRVVEGSSDVVTTPFYSNLPFEQVLSLWNQKLQEVQERWPGLYSFEMEMKEKVGPMSYQAPLSERMDDLYSYYEGVTLPSIPIDQRAIARFVDKWEQAGAQLGRIWNVSKVLENMKLSTNSGSPFFTKRRTVVDKEVPIDAFMGKDGFVRVDYKNGSSRRAAAILGWRGQEGGPTVEDVKQRVIAMFPFSVNIMEARAVMPVIREAQKRNIITPWVNQAEAVDLKITDLFDTKDPDDLIVCSDFSKFDQHFNESLQQCAATVYRQLYWGIGSGIDDWLDDVFPIAFNIPFAYKWNSFLVGKHGMASGSFDTQAAETLAHSCMQEEVALLHGQKLNPNSMCLGDDGLLTYPGIKVADVVEAYSAHGQVMNVDKQFASPDECVFLRRWHHDEYRVDDICVGVYPTMRALGKLMFMERWHDRWSAEDVALRQLAIIEGCRYHPMFEDFVKFCMKGDKYQLGVKLPRFWHRLKSGSVGPETKAWLKQNHPYNPDYTYTGALGYQKPINDWKVVKLLDSLA